MNPQSTAEVANEKIQKKIQHLEQQQRELKQNETLSATMKDKFGGLIEHLVGELKTREKALKAVSDFKEYVKRLDANEDEEDGEDGSEDESESDEECTSEDGADRETKPAAEVDEETPESETVGAENPEGEDSSDRTNTPEKDVQTSEVVDSKYCIACNLERLELLLIGGDTKPNSETGVEEVVGGLMIVALGCLVYFVLSWNY